MKKWKPTLPFIAAAPVDWQCCLGYMKILEGMIYTKTDEK